MEIAISGQVRTTVLAKLRRGGPNTQASVAQKLPAGSLVSVAGIAAGEAVQANPLWFHTADDAYVWAGACGPLLQTGAVAAPPGAGPGQGAAGQAAVGLGEAGTAFPTPRVIDLSHGDRVVNFAAAKAAGVLGVIHKATTGATGKDDLYAARRAAASDAGLLWGAYHWGTAADPQAQVDNFLGWAANDQKTWGAADQQVLVALDFENSVGDQMSLDGARAFCQLVEKTIGRKAVIYSGDLLKSQLGDNVDAYLGGHRLWLAQYGSTPVTQRSWGGYWLWQYTDGVNGPGVKSVAGVPGDASGRLDCDYFDGTPDELATRWAS